MKKILFLSFISIFITGCSGPGNEAKVKPSTSPSRTEKAAPIAEFLTQGIPEKIVKKGTEASGKLLMTLKTQLMAAMQQNGLQGALSFCSANARKLTDDVNLSYLGTLSIKRTSLKYRNPLDKPDQFEETALHLMQKMIAGGGTTSDHLIQKITENGNVKYRYYKPLLISSTCLGCHGDEKKMKPEILRFIRKTYPAGTATGYVKGQLRGVIRVEMNAPTEKPGI